MDKRPKRVRIPHLIASKREGRKIAMLTAYDYTMARLVDRPGSTSSSSAIPWARSCSASTPPCPSRSTT